jgi:hypothetical protein
VGDISGKPGYHFFYRSRGGVNFGLSRCHFLVILSQVATFWVNFSGVLFFGQKILFYSITAIFSSLRGRCRGWRESTAHQVQAYIGREPFCERSSVVLLDSKVLILVPEKLHCDMPDVLLRAVVLGSKEL